MAIVEIPPCPLWMMSALQADTTQATLNAAGESAGGFGQIHFTDGDLSSKVCSAAGGGAIWFRTGTTVTIADGASNLRVGLQDPTAGGLNNDSFDVHCDFTSAAPPAAVSYVRAAMTSGTKTIAPNDYVWGVAEMTAVGGADTVDVDRQNSLGGGFSAIQGIYGSLDTGANNKNAAQLWFAIEFDDGAFGYVKWTSLPTFGNPTALSYSTGSAFDEHGLRFTVRAPLQICAAALVMNNVGSSDAMTFKLYEDPMGTPNAVSTEVFNPNYVSTGTGTSPVPRSTSVVTLMPGITYGFTALATSATTISTNYFDIGASNTALKALLALDDVNMIRRDGSSGAFSDMNAEFLPIFALLLNGIDDGAGDVISVAAHSPMILQAARPVGY